MRTVPRRVAGICAVVGVATLALSAAAFAQNTNITRFTGAPTGSGTWTRTISDVSPSGPNGEAVEAVYTFSVAYTPATTAASFAAAFRTSCIASTRMRRRNGVGSGYSRPHGSTWMG